MAKVRRVSSDMPNILPMMNGADMSRVYIHKTGRESTTSVHGNTDNRRDSLKSNKSLALSIYDPETTGTLPRDAIISMSVYENYDPKPDQLSEFAVSVDDSGDESGISGIVAMNEDPSDMYGSQGLEGSWDRRISDTHVRSGEPGGQAVTHGEAISVEMTSTRSDDEGRMARMSGSHLDGHTKTTVTTTAIDSTDSASDLPKAKVPALKLASMTQESSASSAGVRSARTKTTQASNVRKAGLFQMKSAYSDLVTPSPFPSTASVKSTVAAGSSSPRAWRSVSPPSNRSSVISNASSTTSGAQFGAKSGAGIRTSGEFSSISVSKVSERESGSAIHVESESSIQQRRSSGDSSHRGLDPYMAVAQGGSSRRSSISSTVSNKSGTVNGVTMSVTAQSISIDGPATEHSISETSQYTSSVEAATSEPSVAESTTSSSHGEYTIEGGSETSTAASMTLQNGSQTSIHSSSSGHLQSNQSLVHSTDSGNLKSEEEHEVLSFGSSASISSGRASQRREAAKESPAKGLTTFTGSGISSASKESMTEASTGVTLVKTTSYNDGEIPKDDESPHKTGSTIDLKNPLRGKRSSLYSPPQASVEGMGIGNFRMTERHPYEMHSSVSTTTHVSTSRTQGGIEIIRPSETPTSPMDDLRQVNLKEGNVRKLAEGLKHIPLTGRSITPNTPISPPSTLERGQKFKFAVEGIDIPLQSPEPVAETEVKVTSTTEVKTEVGDEAEVKVDPVSGEVEVKGEEYSTDSLKRERKKGFTYLLDRTLEREIKKKAEDLTARKPHEAIESMPRQKSVEDTEEVQAIRQARAKLSTHTRTYTPSKESETSGDVKAAQVSRLDSFAKLKRRATGEKLSVSTDEPGVIPPPPDITPLLRQVQSPSISPDSAYASKPISPMTSPGATSSSLLAELKRSGSSGQSRSFEYKAKRPLSGSEQTTVTVQRTTVETEKRKSKESAPVQYSSASTSATSTTKEVAAAVAGKTEFIIEKRTSTEIEPAQYISSSITETVETQESAPSTTERAEFIIEKRKSKEIEPAQYTSSSFTETVETHESAPSTTERAEFIIEKRKSKEIEPAQYTSSSITETVETQESAPSTTERTEFIIEKRKSKEFEPIHYTTTSTTETVTKRESTASATGKNEFIIEKRKSQEPEPAQVTTIETVSTRESIPPASEKTEIIIEKRTSREIEPDQGKAEFLIEKRSSKDIENTEHTSSYSTESVTSRGLDTTASVTGKAEFEIEKRKSFERGPAESVVISSTTVESEKRKSIEPEPVEDSFRSASGDVKQQIESMEFLIAKKTEVENERLRRSFELGQVRMPGTAATEAASGRRTSKDSGPGQYKFSSYAIKTEPTAVAEIETERRVSKDLGPGQYKFGSSKVINVDRRASQDTDKKSQDLEPIKYRMSKTSEVITEQTKSPEKRSVVYGASKQKDSSKVIQTEVKSERRPSSDKTTSTNIQRDVVLQRTVTKSDSKTSLDKDPVSSIKLSTTYTGNSLREVNKQRAALASMARRETQSEQTYDYDVSGLLVNDDYDDDRVTTAAPVVEKIDRVELKHDKTPSPPSEKNKEEGLSWFSKASTEDDNISISSSSSSSSSAISVREVVQPVPGMSSKGSYEIAVSSGVKEGGMQEKTATTTSTGEFRVSATSSATEDVAETRNSPIHDRKEFETGAKSHESTSSTVSVTRTTITSKQSARKEDKDEETVHDYRPVRLGVYDRDSSQEGTTAAPEPITNPYNTDSSYKLTSVYSDMQVTQKEDKRRSDPIDSGMSYNSYIVGDSDVIEAKDIETEDNYDHFTNTPKEVSVELGTDVDFNVKQELKYAADYEDGADVDGVMPGTSAELAHVEIKQSTDSRQQRNKSTKHVSPTSAVRRDSDTVTSRVSMEKHESAAVTASGGANLERGRDDGDAGKVGVAVNGVINGSRRSSSSSDHGETAKTSPATQVRSQVVTTKTTTTKTVRSGGEQNKTEAFSNGLDLAGPDVRQSGDKPDGERARRESTASVDSYADNSLQRRLPDVPHSTYLVAEEHRLSRVLQEKIDTPDPTPKPLRTTAFKTIPLDQDRESDNDSKRSHSDRSNRFKRRAMNRRDYTQELKVNTYDRTNYDVSPNTKRREGLLTTTVGVGSRPARTTPTRETYVKQSTSFSSSDGLPSGVEEEIRPGSVKREYAPGEVRGVPRESAVGSLTVSTHDTVPARSVRQAAPTRHHQQHPTPTTASGLGPITVTDGGVRVDLNRQPTDSLSPTFSDSLGPFSPDYGTAKSYDEREHVFHVKDNHLSSTSASSIEYGPLSPTESLSDEPRVIKLKPVKIDISDTMAAQPQPMHMNAHPGVTSPNVRHMQTMMEMSQMTGVQPYGGQPLPHTGQVYRSEKKMNMMKSSHTRNEISRNVHPISSNRFDGDVHPNYYSQRTQAMSVSANHNPDLNIHISGASPGAQPQRKYLKVDESRTGTIPRPADMNGPRAPGRYRTNVARVHLEDDVFDGASVRSEPTGPRRTPLRTSSTRTAPLSPTHVQPLNNSNRAQSRSQPSLVHALNEPLKLNVLPPTTPPPLQQVHTSNTLRSARSEGMLAISPQASTAILSPSLQGAKKERDDYHITLKLNQLTGPTSVSMSRGGVNRSREEYSSMQESVMQRSERYEQQQQYGQMINGQYNQHAAIEHQPRSQASPGYRPSTPQKSTVNLIDVNIIGNEPPRTEANSLLIRHDIGSGQAASTTVSGKRPDFTMAINQTMTMDYVPKEDEEPIDEQMPRSRAPDNQAPIQSPVDEDFRRAYAPYDENDLSPRYNDDSLESEEIPQFVRGQILIKNTIDTTGKAQVVDIVEPSELDGPAVVDDNTNPFHGMFHQSRENPMYSSDEDLRRIGKALEQRPSFTDIYQQDDDEKFMEIPVEYSGKTRATKMHREERLVNGYDQLDSGGGVHETTTKTTTKMYEVPRVVEEPRMTSSRETREMRREVRSSEAKSSRQVARHNLSEIEIARLIKDAPTDSVKQTINVEREEEEILGPLPLNHADGTNTGPDGLLNFDTISEQVDLGVQDGNAQLAVKVRCERVVPIRGVDDMFKKSSVIVTRLISIDLEVTEERRRLLQNIMRGSTQYAIEDGRSRSSRRNEAKLSTKDTFKLYKTFMGLAEHEEKMRGGLGPGTAAKTVIEKRLEDERNPLPENGEFIYGNDRIHDDDEEAFGDEIQMEYDTNELEQRLEKNLVPDRSDVLLREVTAGRGHARREQDADTISYSEITDTDSMLF